MTDMDDARLEVGFRTERGKVRRVLEFHYAGRFVRVLGGLDDDDAFGIAKTVLAKLQPTLEPQEDGSLVQPQLVSSYPYRNVDLSAKIPPELVPGVGDE